MPQLQNNTTNLQTILAKVNSLPNAGSGGSSDVETCTVTIIPQWLTMYNLTCTVIGSSGAVEVVHTRNASTSITIDNVIVGSAISLTASSMSVAITTSGEATLIEAIEGAYGTFTPVVISPTANATITISDNS